MRGIKIPQQDFALKMPGGLMREGGAYLRDTTVLSWNRCCVSVGGLPAVLVLGTAVVWLFQESDVYISYHGSYISEYHSLYLYCAYKYFLGTVVVYMSVGGRPAVLCI